MSSENPPWTEIFFSKLHPSFHVDELVPYGSDGFQRFQYKNRNWRLGGPVYSDIPCGDSNLVLWLRAKEQGIKSTYVAKTVSNPSLPALLSMALLSLANTSQVPGLQ